MQKNKINKLQPYSKNGLQILILQETEYSNLSYKEKQYKMSGFKIFQTNERI